MYRRQNRGFFETFAPPVTRNLIFLNLVIWLAQVILERSYGIDLARGLGLHYVFGSEFSFYQPITYQFLHSTQGLEHVFFNMFSLWMFGSAVERAWGAQRYLIFYLCCGLSAAFTQEIVWHISLGEYLNMAEQVVRTPYGLMTMEDVLNLPVTIGASGSVFGILLACGVLFPNAQMFIFPLPFPIRLKYMVVGYGLIELFMGVSATGSSVAHFAHLGGMIGGLVLILRWRKRGIINGSFR